MKRLSFIVATVALSVMFLASCGGPSSDEIRIGDQIWMTKNLNIDKFRNGDIIPHAKTDKEWLEAGKNKQPAWCYYDNDPSKGSKFGKLYNGYAVIDPRGLAPQGWYIPSTEFFQLKDTLGGAVVAGSKMKSTSGWKNSGGGTNESRFYAMPAGVRTPIGTFKLIDECAYYWGDIINDSFFDETGYYFLQYDSPVLNSNEGSPRYGFSVRCVKE